MKSAKGSGEIDAIKAFILIMAVLTVGLLGYSLFFLKGQLGELESANSRAKRYCEKMAGQRDEVGLVGEVERFLNAYSEAKKAGGISSPEEYVALVIRNTRLDPKQVDLEARREVGRSTKFRTKYEQVKVTDVTWDQAIAFMWNFEHNSPKYRVLSIEDLRRMKPKTADDRWKLEFRAAYRTPR